jgi:CheY-like chemotaxis protein
MLLLGLKYQENDMDKKKVMIVDDEEDFLFMAKKILEKTGKYEIMTLSSAKDIIDKVHAFDPAVILLDLLMPSIGGLEVCEMLNNDPAGQRIPIIVISALGSDKDKLKAYKLGIIDYLEKPVDKKTLIAMIEKTLRFR